MTTQHAAPVACARAWPGGAGRGPHARLNHNTFTCSRADAWSSPTERRVHVFCMQMQRACEDVNDPPCAGRSMHCTTQAVNGKRRRSNAVHNSSYSSLAPMFYGGYYGPKAPSVGHLKGLQELQELFFI